MADDNTIIEGSVKFRDGKKWKSRWGVMRKLSPVADCVQLVLWGDARSRWGGAASKAALSLQRFVGCEAGFTLDKHSHTLALLCADFTAVLAFESRERLLQWQVKLAAHLGEARSYLVLLGGGKPGPARLHLHRRSCALSAGVPPRLLGLWKIAHLRRYGVVDGRFCFEGGSHCGKGQGLHVLISEQAADIQKAFQLAARGQLSPKHRASSRKNDGFDSPTSQKAFRAKGRTEPQTIERSLPPTDLRLYDDPCVGEEPGLVSPYWPSGGPHFEDLGFGDASSANDLTDGGDAAPWGASGHVMLERCMSCISKLGALSRSSTAALTPGAKHFSPAWTMDEGEETLQDANKSGVESGKPNATCRCRVGQSPDRPPKPAKLDLKLARKPPMPLPVRSFSHAHLSSIQENSSSDVGPYENYDVPKIRSAEVEGEYYDTPKRLKECLNNELFKMTKSCTTDTIVLKKSCGCLLKFGKKPNEPTVVDSDETFQQSSCACQKVTDWANNWIKLPSCNKTDPVDSSPPTEDPGTDRNALYATIDLSRKTRRKSLQQAHYVPNNMPKSKSLDNPEVDDGPLANYENLNFALSLEHYENAKELLKRAGVTQRELDALSANLGGALTSADSEGRPAGDATCAKCGHPRDLPETRRRGASPDEYLMMAPNSLDDDRLDYERPLPAGYTPMSPIGGFAFHTLKYPAKSPVARLLDEKSASNPTLGGAGGTRAPAEGDEPVQLRPGRERPDRRKRSSSADSSRFLEDEKESASSIETLRDIRLDATAGECAAKHSDAESSEASKSKGEAPPAGGNRDSSSSNDSGVSSWSLRGEPGAAGDFELPATTAAARRRYRSARRAHAPPRPPPRRSRSYECRSADAELPALPDRPLRGAAVADSRSTSSGTSDTSDYIETLSICSSHSSSDTPVATRDVDAGRLGRAGRHSTSTLRPRSGKEYSPRAPQLRGAGRPSRRLP